MKLRLLAVISLTLAMSVYQSIPAMACTIFTVVLEDGTVLAGNNEDYSYSINNSMVVTAPSEEGYGRICFYNMSYIQGGMNEHGLFYDGASCPPSEVPHYSDRENLDYNLGDIVLAKCASVEEVEKFFENYNIPSGFYDHLLFADSTGASAVFEWVGGELHIIHKDRDENYQVITNYWLTNPSLGGYPCDRYNTVVDLLQCKSPSVELCADVLNSTKQNWAGGGTLYSNIYNLSSKEIYVFNRGRMDQACKIDMEELFQSMQAEPKVSYNLNDLTYDIQFTVSNLRNDNLPETDNSSIPESDGDMETSAAITKKNIFYDNLVLWILGICILGYIVALLLIKKKGKKI
ncbi:carcinine hydrolase/isopenicillin-N N-acyltransferase family protein [Acetivibrio clariflavus]|uniref:carcinine hydrolase/isopenicillin-N N-acyltransferase family protein n=1 Tax=Acetivibrio clariflavus TaxID=288965 RepID=UPI0004887772|nr:carcinine hydrolase/isopenicillin-N N-acyltransferase family protein [Acetivibrio clariflavus]